MLIKKCIVCDKEFTKPVSCSLVDWHGGKRRPNGKRYCSKKCADINKVGKHYSSSTEFKKGSTSWLKGTKGLVKPNSGSFKRGNIPWLKGKKLSPKHYQKLKDAGFFKPKFGKKSANWKGGITKLGAAIRTMSEYKKWRTSIFKRDGYKCIECGGHHVVGDRRDLQVHHVKAFYKIIEENKIKTLKDARNCKDLWNLDNGITLCIPCHKQTDSCLVNQHTR